MQVAKFPRKCDNCGYEFFSSSTRPTCPKCKKTRGHWLSNGKVKYSTYKEGKLASEEY